MIALLQPLRLPVPRMLPLAVLLGGALNGWVFQIVDAWHERQFDAVGGLFGLSPLMLLVAVIALLLWRAAPVRPVSWGALAPAMAMLLLPSSLLAWLFTFLLAAWLGWGQRGPARHAAWLLAGLSAAALWQVLGIRLLGDWLLVPDAVVVQHGLALVRAGIERHGNVVGVPGSHQIVVLAGCSTLQTLPLVAVGALAAGALRGAGFGPGRPALACLVFVALNLVRLHLLGWSAPFYALVHGPVGQNAFDGLVIALLLAQPARMVGAKS